SARRNTPAGPTGEGLLERIAYPGTEPELVGHLAGRDAMGDEDPLERLLPEGGELGSTSEALEWGPSEPDVTHREGTFREPDEIHVVPIPPEDDVVAEPVRQLRRFCDATDHRERDDVVQGLLGVRLEPDRPGDAPGDEPRSEQGYHGLHGAGRRSEGIGR